MGGTSKIPLLMKPRLGRAGWGVEGGEKGKHQSPIPPKPDNMVARSCNWGLNIAVRNVGVNQLV